MKKLVMEMQHIKISIYILLSLLIFNGQVSMAQTESNTSQDFEPKSYDELFEYYQKNGSTRFDSFHHEYLMMYSLGFPNLKKHTRSAQKFGLDEDTADFSNPQYVLKNKDRIFEMAKSLDLEFMPDHKNRVFPSPIPEGASSLYKKNGYYKDYKKNFSGQGDGFKQEVCFHLSFIEDRSKLIDLSVTEFENIIENTFIDVLAPIVTKQKAKKIYPSLDNIQCFGLFVTEAQLDYLFQHQKVIEIYPPKLEYFIPPPVIGR